MSKAFDSIKQGLQEAIDHARGDNEAVRVYRPPVRRCAGCAPARLPAILVERPSGRSTFFIEPACDT